MESIWTTAKVVELEFAATSHLLAKHANKRSITPAEQLNDVSSDEDECEEDEGDCVTSRPSPNLARHQHDALINKFLDRLAEVFSREKSSPGCSSRKDSKHIVATAWINPNHRSEEALTVIVAKNEGLDGRDVEMLAGLQSWLREVAATGTVQSAQTDTLWVGNEGLVEFSRHRSWCYISWLKENDGKVTSLATSSTENTAQLARLQRLYQDISCDSATQHFSKIVDVAYDLRSTWKARPMPGEHMKAVRTVNMLGRLRAAYECFKSAALTFDTLAGLEMKPVSPRQDVRRKVTLSRTLLQGILTECNLPTDILQDKTKHSVASRLHVHAEMQILVHLAQNPDWQRRAHRYIGVSKNLCFLCDKILQNYSSFAEQGTRRPAFRARQCHSKVYPLWTLPECKDLPCVSKSSLVIAVTCTYDQMRRELQQKLRLRPAIAESSAGVTSAGSVSTGLARLRDQHVAGRRLQATAKTEKEDQRSRGDGFGPEVATVKVGILPANGTQARLVPITFHALPETLSHRTIEAGRQYVPDFRLYWHEHQFDRRLWSIKSKEQANESWNGRYRLYWNENDALPENETVKRLLGEKQINPMRRFWRGDVFFMKYSEHPQTYEFAVHDLPFTMLECQFVLEQSFRDMWKEETLEAEAEQDRAIAELQEKFEADKEILLQRMTPVEQALLKLMPPGTLDHLAISECDDGAMRDVKVEEHPDDPTMVRVSSMVRQTALEIRGWTGFGSKHV